MLTEEHTGVSRAACEGKGRNSKASLRRVARLMRSDADGPWSRRCYTGPFVRQKIQLWQDSFFLSSYLSTAHSTCDISLSSASAVYTRIPSRPVALFLALNAAPSKRFDNLETNKTLKQVRYSHRIARQQRPWVFCCPALIDRAAGKEDDE